MDPQAILEWHLEAGADEAIGSEPRNWLKPPLPSADVSATRAAAASVATASSAHVAASMHPLVHTPSAGIAVARALATQAQTLAELEDAVRNFEGCALKRTAGKTVFCDGSSDARVMLIGEAPGAQEDIQGVPFCGPSGMLLDKMFAAIGLDRTKIYISNTVFWRPPGNRQPSKEETAICLPFVEKHIALKSPALLIACGGVASSVLMRSEMSLSRLRGKTHSYSNEYLPGPVALMLTYHPSYLMRSPGQKRLAWQDLLAMREWLDANLPGYL